MQFAIVRALLHLRLAFYSTLLPHSSFCGVWHVAAAAGCQRLDRGRTGERHRGRRGGSRLAGGTEFCRANVKASFTRCSMAGVLTTQVALAAALCGVFLIPAVINVAYAIQPATWAISADGVLGWTAVAIATVAAMWLNGRHVLSQAAVALIVAVFLSLITLTVARSNTSSWAAYHTLLAGCCAAACLLPPAARAANRFVVSAGEAAAAAYWSAPSVRLFAAASVFLAFWEYANASGAPWWTVAALTITSARNIWIAYREGGRGGMWLAALLFMPAVSILWLDWGSKLSYFVGLDGILEFLWVSVLAAAILAVISVWIDAVMTSRNNLQVPNLIWKRAPDRSASVSRFIALPPGRSSSCWF